MRTAILLVAVVSLAGCHKPKDRGFGAGFKQMGKNLAKVGRDIASVARKAVPVPVNIKLDAKVRTDIAAIANQRAQQQVDQRIAAIAPITIRKSARQRAVEIEDETPAATPTMQPEPAQQMPAPEPVVTRRTMSSGSEQVWKNMFRAGEKATCEKVETFDSCQATCTEHMRGESMRQLHKDAGKPVQCECTQGHSKC